MTALVRVRFFFIFFYRDYIIVSGHLFLGNQPILFNEPSLENFNFNQEEDRIFIKKKKNFVASIKK